MPLYEIGQQVRYKAIGGPSSEPPPLTRLTNSLFFHTGPDSKTPATTGTICDIITEPRRMAGHNVQASEEDPRYDVRQLIHFAYSTDE